MELQHKVTLKSYTDLQVCSDAIRTCWDSFDNSDGGGTKDKALIDRVGNKFKHGSTLEHLNYTFFIDGISRAVLQELARHRIASLSVKSTRYTLKELKTKDLSNTHGNSILREFIVFTGNDFVDSASITALRNVKRILLEGASNDVVKYCLPEAYKTSLTWTINARSLQNFLQLRTNKSALKEIQLLAHSVYDVIPSDHKYIFEDCVNTYD